VQHYEEAEVSELCS